MPVKKEVSKKSTAERLPSTAKKAEVRSRKSISSFSIPVYSLTGRAAGTLALPKEIFGQKVNKQLLAQAVRIYMTNQRTLTGSTKSRGEVVGSTAKIYRQKGTGRARHGSIRAPIFVGGGIAFGPKPRKVRLDLPKKMKKAALISALSSKVVDKNVIGFAGAEKASGKTKEMIKLMEKLFAIRYSQLAKSPVKDEARLWRQKPKARLAAKRANSALIVANGKTDNVVRAVRNIPGVDILPANLLNAYEVLRHDMLILTKEAVEKLSKSKDKEQK